MSTTAIFAEILIIGVQACVWVSMLVFAALPHFRKTVWSLLGRSDVLLAVFGLAMVYTLGILVDRTADTLSHLLCGRLLKKVPKFSVMRLRVMQDEGRAAFIEYQRHRLRIARATMVNTGLILVAGVALLLRGYFSDPRWPSDFWLVAGLFLAGGMVVLVASCYASQRIHNAHANRLIQAYRMWEDDENRASDFPIPSGESNS